MKVLFLTLVTLLLSNAQSVDIHTKDVYLIVKGVIEGVKVDEHIEVSEIISCLNDSEELINNLVKAITALETQTFEGVKDGIKLIGIAIQQIPDAITACESGSQEMIALSKILTNLLEELRSPLSFSYKIGYNLLVNGLDIYKEISTAVKDWKEESYEDFGQQVGFVLVQLLSRIQNIDAYIHDTVVIETVFDGLLEGIVDASKIKAKDVKECLSGAKEIIIDFQEAVRLLQTGTAENVIQALQTFAKGLEEFPIALESCTAAGKEALELAKELRELIITLSDPYSFAYHIGKDLIVNGKDIYQEVFTAVDDWKTGNWFDFGFQLGRAMYQIFVGQQQIQ